MNIYLDKDFRMKNDPNNLILERRSLIEDKNTKEVREVWSNAGNYTSIPSLLHGYLKKSIIKTSAGSLEELAAAVKQIGDNIDQYIKDQSR